ncbi:hypothetical protein E2C01_008288 [Portunus trituberculatus]|uniref:Uncharacterized protein n=1 Tax=Portunus trituberculatus TaxID=210409 RepID=A0A5B7D4C4_PORTR|nr:hypothetical protein [Portunus trituberculatus]
MTGGNPGMLEDRLLRLPSCVKTSDLTSPHSKPNYTHLSPPALYQPATPCHLSSRTESTKPKTQT